MKNILITSGIFPPDIGGPSTYAETIANSLYSKGFGISILAYSKNFKTENTNSKYPFKVIRVWGGWPIWVKHLIFGIKLLNLTRNHETIFALNIWNAGFPSFLAAKILRKKFFVKIVGDYAWEVAVGKNKTDLLIDDFQNTKKRGWIGYLYKLQGMICKKAETIIVPSKYLFRVVKGWGVEEKNIKLIYNGTDFKPLDIEKEKARHEIGISGNIILSIGRLVPWKGFKMLIKIMPELIKEYNFARLVIVGDGPDREILETMKNNLGLQNKVYLVGKKSPEELKTYLAAADMFVLNTAYEGFSHQLLEAMAAQVPVVTTNAGGNPELIKQGENGFMVLYNDELNLTEAIKAIFDHEDIRLRFIEEGKKTVRKFTVEKMAKETLEILNSLIKNG